MRAGSGDVPRRLSFAGTVRKAPTRTEKTAPLRPLIPRVRAAFDDAAGDDLEEGEDFGDEDEDDDEDDLADDEDDELDADDPDADE